MAEEKKETGPIMIRGRTEEEQKYINVLESLVDYYLKHHYVSRFDIIKAKQLFAGDEKIAVKNTLGSDALSVERYGLIDAVHDAFEKELLSQNFTPKTIPLHPAHREYSSEAQDTYDWMYHVSNYEKNVVEKAIKEATLIGDSYVFFGKKNTGKYEIPTTEHISFFEMFIEPMATDFESSRYKVIRKIVNSIDIIKKYDKVIDWDGFEMYNAGEDIKDNKNAISNRDFILDTIDNSVYQSDFRKLRDVAYYETEYTESVDSCCNGPDGGSAAKTQHFETGAIYEELFGFDKESKLCELTEIREKTSDGHKVTVLINGYKLPYEQTFDFLPFANIYYEENIGSPIHRGIGHKLMPKQRSCDLMQFTINNGVKMHAFPDWISSGGLKNSSDSDVKNLNWSGKQNVYKTNNSSALQGKQPFTAIEYISKDVLNIARIRLQEVEAEGFRDVGLNSYISGGDGRVERISGAFQERIKQSRARLKTIKKSMSEALNKSFYVRMNWLGKGFEKLLLEAIDKNGEVVLLDLERDDIKNNFDIMLSSEGYHEDTLKDMGQNILNTINAFGNILTDPKTGKPMYDKEELAYAVADKYGVEGLHIYTNKEMLEQFEKDKEQEFNMAKIELEYQKKLAEIMPPPPEQTAAQDQQAQGGGQEILITDENGNPIQ